MKEEHIDIFAVSKRNGYDGHYRVQFTTSTGSCEDMMVYAHDEMEAYTKATQVIRSNRMNMRYLMVCSTLIILSLFGVIGYGCSQPSAMEVCLAAGKTYQYIEAPNHSENNNVTTCK